MWNIRHRTCCNKTEQNFQAGRILILLPRNMLKHRCIEMRTEFTAGRIHDFSCELWFVNSLENQVVPLYNGNKKMIGFSAMSTKQMKEIHLIFVNIFLFHIYLFFASCFPYDFFFFLDFCHNFTIIYFFNYKKLHM